MIYFSYPVGNVYISLCQVGLIFLACHCIFIIIGSVLKLWLGVALIVLYKVSLYICVCVLILYI